MSNNEETTRDASLPDEILPLESDDIEKIGTVFFVRSGVWGLLEKQSHMHHWALGISFPDKAGDFWVLLEGVRRHLTLTSKSRIEKKLDNDYQIFRLNEYIPQLKELSTKQCVLAVLSLTTAIKAMSGTTLRTVKASPMQLRAIAESIENAPYVPGINDCHTWFLRALSKLEHYQVGEKSLDEMAIDTVTNTVGVASKPLFEVASGGTSAVCELVETGKKLGTIDGNTVEEVATGSANTVNYLIKGVTHGAGAGLDAAGGAVANLVGLATVGGCASKNPNANLNSTLATNTVQAGVHQAGHVVGNLAYAVSGGAKSAVEGVSELTTTCVSGATKVVGTSITQVGKGLAAGFKSLGFGKQQ